MEKSDIQDYMSEQAEKIITLFVNDLYDEITRPNEVEINKTSLKLALIICDIWRAAKDDTIEEFEKIAKSEMHTMLNNL